MKGEAREHLETNCEGLQAPRSQVLSSSWSLVGRKVIVRCRAVVLDRARID